MSGIYIRADDAICLRGCYTMAGTDIRAYRATQRAQKPDAHREPRTLSCPIFLCACYAVPSTGTVPRTKSVLRFFFVPRTTTLLRLCTVLWLLLPGADPKAVAGRAWERARGGLSPLSFTRNMPDIADFGSNLPERARFGCFPVFLAEMRLI
eukprot:2038841-Rhodomonas_salina.3